MNSIPLRRLNRAAFTALLLGLSAAANAQYTYAITDLGTLGGSSSMGYGVNGSGQIAGFANLTGDASFHAFRYSGGTMQDLGTLGGSSSKGFGINGSGEVTGFSHMPGNRINHAFLYSGATMKDLGTLGGTSSYGEGINGSKQVAGYSDIIGDGIQHAFRYSGMTMQDLGTLGGSSSKGFGINNLGQVTGFSYTTGDAARHATIWTLLGNAIGIRDIGTLGGNESQGLAINDNGQVAGFSYLVGNAVTHAFRYSGGSLNDLGSFGGTDCHGEGINSSGVAVGYSLLPNGVSHAFYAVGDTMNDLNDLLPGGSGWVLNEARDITDTFNITGYGTIKGQTHAYLLAPVAVTLSGSIALESITDLSKTSPYAPLGVFHIALRTPSTTKEVVSVNATLTAMKGSKFGIYTLPQVPFGVYDLAIEGGKNLRVVKLGVTIAYGATLPPVTLPAGDANNDNSVDSTDFGVLIGAYNSSASIPGSGYDATADFNYDGFVDSTDFGLLIGEFNNVGDP